MKKLSLSVLGALLLTVFSSCAFNNQNSSVTFKFPENASEHFTAFRDVEASGSDDSSEQNKYYVTFTSTGDWEYTETKYFSKLENINGSKFEFTDLKANSTINVTLLLGSIENEHSYYEASTSLTLEAGDNLLVLKLQLAQVEIPDFIITAKYASDDTVYDGSSAIDRKNDTLIFYTDSDYEDGITTWKINDNEFDGTLSQAEIREIEAGTNTVECTITDKAFSKVTKSATFEFGFLDFPKALTLGLEEGIDASNLIYSENYNLVISELKSLASDTEYTWTLTKDNKTEEISVSDFVFDTKAFCSLIVEGTEEYTIGVKAVSEIWNWSAEGELTVTINPSKQLPKNLTLNFADESITEITYFDVVNLAIAEKADLKSGTSFSWTLNEEEISLEDTEEGFVFDSGKLCELSSDSKDYVLTVTAANNDYEDWTACCTMNIKVNPAECFPKTITLALKDSTTPENTIVYGNKYELSIKEKSQLKDGTSFSWTINDKTVTQIKDFIFDTKICDIVNGVMIYNIKVTATYSDENLKGSWTAVSDILTLTISNGDAGISILCSVPDFTVTGEYNKETHLYVFTPAEKNEGDLFNLGTSFSWKLNGTYITETSNSYTIDVSNNVIINNGTNILECIATYQNEFKSASCKFILPVSE